MVRMTIPGNRCGATLALLLCAIGALLYGCALYPLPVPYTPESQTQRDLSAVPNPDHIRLSVGPRSFLEQMGKGLRGKEERIELLDGQTFIDTAAPDGDLTLARLLDAASGPLIEPLHADYLVLISEPRLETIRDISITAALRGFATGTQSSVAWGVVVDLQGLKMADRLTTTSSGTFAVALWGSIFVTPFTDNAAREGLIRNLAQTLTAGKPQGRLRVALLAAETLATPKEILRARRTEVFADPFGKAFHAYPLYAEPSPPRENEGLVMLYRLAEGHVPWGERPIQADTGEGAFEAVRLPIGGYFPLRVPAGTLRLWGLATSAEPLVIDVQPGSTQFVLSKKDALKVVDERQARQNIVLCRLLPSMRDYVAALRAGAEEGYTWKQYDLAKLYSQGVDYAGRTLLPRDRVEAYKWYTVIMESEGVEPFVVDWAQRYRGDLETGMTQDEKAEGYRRGYEWLQEFERAFFAAPPSGSELSPGGATDGRGGVVPAAAPGTGGE